MIFAHLPAGYLLSKPLQLSFWKRYSPRQKILLTLVASVSAILPDLDFVYYYFFSSERNHRQFITHTPFFILLFWLLLFLVAKIKGSVFSKQLSLAFLLGVFAGHLFLDTLVGGIMWLYPFSDSLFTLKGIFPSDGFLGFHSQFLGLFLELLIIIAAVGIFLWQHAMTLFKRCFAGIASFGILIFFLSLLVLSQPFLVTRHDTFLADTDGDGLRNYQDPDIDNDGIPNNEDTDRDGDNTSDKEEFIAAARKLNGKWYNFWQTENYLNIPKHLGFIDASDIVVESLAEAGYLVGTEIWLDAAQNPVFYRALSEHNTSVEDSAFYERPYNIALLLSHSRRFLSFSFPGDISLLQTGDILFWGDPAYHLGALFTDDRGQSKDLIHYLVLEAHPSYPVSEMMPIDEILQREGIPSMVARILP